VSPPPGWPPLKPAAAGCGQGPGRISHRDRRDRQSKITAGAGRSLGTPVVAAQAAARGQRSPGRRMAGPPWRRPHAGAIATGAATALRGTQCLATLERGERINRPDAAGARTCPAGSTKVIMASWAKGQRRAAVGEQRPPRHHHGPGPRPLAADNDPAAKRVPAHTANSAER